MHDDSSSSDETPIPERLREELDDQDPETLRAVASYATDRIVAGDAESSEPARLTGAVDDLPDRLRAVIDERAAGKDVTVKKRYRQCLDGCSSCPHGPYHVAVWKEDGCRHWEWLDSSRNA